MANFNLNKVILGGRLTDTPELKQTNSGVNFVNFTMAVNRPYSKGQDKQTDFINVVAWRQRAEFVVQWFKKGSSICIVGSIQTRAYEDKDGKKRTATDVVADEVGFVDSKEEPLIYDTRTSPADQDDEPHFEDVTEDDDLPF